MRILTTLLSLSLLVALTGCGSVVIQGDPDGGAASDAPLVNDRPSPGDAPLPPVDRPPPIDVPRTCTSTADCGPGLECLGGEGCGTPWTCQPALGRPCTADYSPFCGCDGATFYGSSSCPSRPFLHRGPCGPIDAGPAGCPMPDGSVCAVGQVCRTGECTTCFCAAPGMLRCTGGCVDAGPPPRLCRSNVDCSVGQMCAGPEGCGVPWTCQPAPPCTRDLAPYCGCDGTTFMASSTCPGRPYQHRGNCSGVIPDAGPGTCTITCGITPGCAMDGGVDPPPYCPPQDARGVGACAAFFGYAWDGSQCVGVSGCSCSGTECRTLARDPMECELAHRLCPRPL